LSGDKIKGSKIKENREQGYETKEPNKNINRGAETAVMASNRALP
jgi:hypothetical protein